jgi:hypothetical protein
MPLLLATVLVITLVPALPASAAPPNISGGGTFAYTEQDPAIPVGTGITITNGSFYDGKYIEFAGQRHRRRGSVLVDRCQRRYDQRCRLDRRVLGVPG